MSKKNGKEIELLDDLQDLVVKIYQTDKDMATLEFKPNHQAYLRIMKSFRQAESMMKSLKFKLNEYDKGRYDG